MAIFTRMISVVVLLLASASNGASAAALQREGNASWYQAHRGATASGARHAAKDLSAAHPWLPFGSKVMVTNLRNGRSVIVAITDRGPFTGGRVIDVSQAAARELGFLRAGTTRVRIDQAKR